MARSPLLSRFQTLFADFEEAERSGRSVAEIREERRSMRFTRRDFLKVAGAAVGAAALSGPAAALAATATRGSVTQGAIAIIGGGIAGLNAALTLQDAGIASTVYEASSRVGGRMHSDTTSWLNGHTSPMGQLLDVAYNIEYGNITKEQSSLNLIYLLGFSSNPGNFQIFGASDERYHIAGGNERLPQAIAAALTLGTVQLNTALTGILRNSDGTYNLSLKSGNTATSKVVDRVIMAIPFSILRTILTSDLDYQTAGFTPLKQTAISQLGYGKNAKLHLQFDTRYWNSPGPWGIGNGSTYSDTGYQNTWDVTRAQDGTTGLLVDYTGGGVPLASFGGDPTNAAQVAKFAKAFLSQIEPVFPGITRQWNGRATLDVPLTDPFLLGSYSYWKVGQYTQFAGYEKVRQPPVTGKCHFAGEHCSQDFQGYMEGGASEGLRAANEIIDDYKVGLTP